jgi:hypothetical protein
MFYFYKKNFCALFQLIKYLKVNKCGCQFGGFDFFYNNNVSACSIKDLCPFTNIKIFSASSSAINDCDCPLECETTSYTYSTSCSDYPSNYTFSNNLIGSSTILKHIQTYDELKRSVLKVNIFYDELKTTTITQDAKTSLSDFISSIGGTLGLFLGFSFLSFIELFEVILNVLLIVCKSDRIRMTINLNQNSS